MNDRPNPESEVQEHSIQALTFKPVSLTKYKYYKNDEFQQGSTIKKDNAYSFVINYIPPNKRGLIRDYLDRSQSFFIDVVNQEIVLLGYDQSIDEVALKNQLMLSMVDMAKAEPRPVASNLDTILHKETVEKILDKHVPMGDIRGSLK